MGGWGERRRTRRTLDQLVRLSLEDSVEVGSYGVGLVVRTKNLSDGEVVDGLSVRQKKKERLKRQDLGGMTAV